VPQVIITAGARVGWKAAAASLQKRVPKQPGGPGRRSRANSGCCKTPQRLAARCRRNQSCGSWSSALGIPAMWRCTATSRMRVPFTYWPSGTRKKPGIERDHGSVLTPPDDAGGAAATAGVPKMRPPGNSSRPDAQVLSGNHPKRVRNLSKPGVRQFSCHNS